MQILSAEQTRAWDQYTIQHEPISSIDLMERAAGKCVDWLKEKSWQGKQFKIFCGKGNNGGDGLVIGRKLIDSGYSISIFILESGKDGSKDFQTALQRLQQIPNADIHFFQSDAQFPPIQKEEIVIDALFGSGLNKSLEGLAKALVLHINRNDATVISIDLPSGLFIEESSLSSAVVEADYTLTFQCYKLGLLVQENAPFIGDVVLLDISLHPHFLQEISSASQLLDEGMIRKIFRPRKRFSHKGTFGHALMIGGSYGKMGAIVLATKACLAAGAGLTTSFVPKCGYGILQTTAPEAMALVDDNEDCLTSLPAEMDRFTSIGIGPGMGTKPATQNLLSFVIRRYQKPMVIDADGLNGLAQHKDLLSQLPQRSILTPHPKEFDRLFGDHQNDFERLQKAVAKAKELEVIIVLKSHHTLIALPNGNSFFNATGNAGMAKGGSGDVLTGILASLLAQGYQPEEAAQLGVYIHGWAGDIAAKKHSMEAMLPSHLLACLKNVFLALNKKKEE